MVNAFVVEPIWKSVSTLAGSGFPSSLTPYALRKTTLSSCTTAMASAGKCHAAIASRAALSKFCAAAANVRKKSKSALMAARMVAF